MPQHDDHKHPTVARSFVTEQASKKIFEALIPNDWIVRKLSPDFHLDYLVEITQSGELTGINFGVQLKGHVPRKDKQQLTYRLDSKHLLYYQEKCFFPVFLVLLDVKAWKGYWVFVQQYAQQKFSPEQSKKEKVTIAFFENDSVSNTSRLLQAVLDAAQYMRELHPGSIMAATNYKKKQLEAHDERVDVQINFSDGAEHIILHPKETFPFTLKFKNDDPTTWQAIREFVERGTDLKLKHSEVEFEGAPILEAVNKGQEGHLVIQHKHEVDGHVVISWTAANAQDQVHIPGRFSGGQKYSTFRGVLPNSALEISLDIGLSQASKQEPFNLSIEIKCERWAGQRLVLLAYFEQIYSLANAMSAHSRATLDVYAQGNRMVRATTIDMGVNEFSGIMNLLELLKKARTLARHFKVDPILPSLATVELESLSAIHELYDVMFRKEYVVAVPNLKMRGTISNAEGDSLPDSGAGVFMVVKPVQKYSLFGQEVQTGPICRRFTSVVVSDCVKNSGSKKVTFILTGNSDTKMIVSLGESSSKDLLVSEHLS